MEALGGGVRLRDREFDFTLKESRDWTPNIGTGLEDVGAGVDGKDDNLIKFSVLGSNAKSPGAEEEVASASVSEAAAGAASIFFFSASLR